MTPNDIDSERALFAAELVAKLTDAPSTPRPLPVAHDLRGPRALRTRKPVRVELVIALLSLVGILLIAMAAIHLMTREPGHRTDTEERRH